MVDGMLVGTQSLLIFQIANEMANEGVAFSREAEGVFELGTRG